MVSDSDGIILKPSQRCAAKQRRELLETRLVLGEKRGRKFKEMATKALLHNCGKAGRLPLAAVWRMNCRNASLTAGATGGP